MRPALDEVPVVDQHCHGLLAAVPTDDPHRWRRLFTESDDPSGVPTTVSYQRLLRRLAAFLDCAPAEDAVLDARSRWAPLELAGALLRDARISALVVDTGYPPPEQLLSNDAVGRVAGCAVSTLLRVEPLMQDLVAAHTTLDGVVEAMRAALRDVRGAGHAGLKSIVAYRTGLKVARWGADEVAAAFRAARREAVRSGAVRLGCKPLLDTLLHVALAEAAAQELPVQFHTGYGDRDADLRLADPLHLRAVLEDPAYHGLTVVLLHGSYPFTRQAAVLAALYPNVVVDLSYGIPFLSLAELAGITQAALGAAPAARIVCSSDGVGVPELHWMAAHDARRILGAALGELVSTGEIAHAQALEWAAAILHGNGQRLYRIAS
ncbi:MAG: amidohydrolase family protein [Egibacteraceae bacterium]